MREIALAQRDSEQLSPGMIETVRCEIQDADGRILLLLKDRNSKNPGMYEFPGGKIEKIRGAHAQEDEQISAAIQEVLEETGLDISEVPLVKKGSYQYSFIAGGQREKRDVSLYHAKLPPGKHIVTVNQTRRADGKPEDNHAGYRWVTLPEFQMLQSIRRIATNSILPIHKNNHAAISSNKYNQ